MRVAPVSQSDNGIRVCAASARISTKEGTAQYLFDAAEGGEKDKKLIKKVFLSGHRSLLEHTVATFAFTDVPVTVEQFLIEHRLCSFTVKSRRYVNYTDTGFYIPEGLSDEKKAQYTAHMQRLFSAYTRLVELGVPMEDARFVLPYCFLSNFYATANVREWLAIARDMTVGRGQLLQELRDAAQPICAYLEEHFPGALDLTPCGQCRPVQPSCEAVGASHAEQGHAGVLCASAYRPEMDEKAVVADSRPRELEMMQYVLHAENVSLAAVTHFARHRMQSPLFPDSASVLVRNAHILPESIKANPEALAVYEDAFAENEKAAKAMLSENCLRFYALAGNTCDFDFAMNARELLHFMQLRTCNRAQWEIRSLAWEMLRELRERDPKLFCEYGPSCYVTGKCPEGRLSCGKPYRKEEAL